MNDKKSQLVTYSHPDAIISDQFRTIRTNIKFLTENKGNNVILVTSPGDGEGKSTTIANLAVSIARQNEKVLLIDADLRTPGIHRIFYVTNQNGLANVLQGMTRLKDAVSSTDVEHLDVLPSGVDVANPTELLGSTLMTDVIQEAANHYDMVLIDSPTLLTSTETRLLANQCTGVVLIVNRGKTAIAEVVEAKRVLTLAHAKLMGAIFNGD